MGWPRCRKTFDGSFHLRSYRYLGLCGTGSVVPACMSAPAISGLANASSYQADVQTLCNAMEMDGCSACTGAASDSTSALEASCPNPLGTLSALCLEMNMDGCGDWETFCTANSGSFPSLCGTTPSPTPGSPVVMSPFPASPPPSTNPNWAVGGCYSDPTQASCADFKQDEAITQQNITTLCNSMPFMTGCSLWDQCNVGWFFVGVAGRKKE